MAAAHKLFLVDASVTIQRVIELTFAGEDVDVVTVSDGEQAIARISIERPDIVLADIGVPRRNGYEVAAFIRGQSDLRHIPVLLMAGAFEPVDEVKAEQAGVDGVLMKPFEPQHVITRVRELLESAKVRGVQRAAPVAAAPAAAPTAPPASLPVALPVVSYEPPPVERPMVASVAPVAPVYEAPIYIAPPEPVRAFVPEPIPTAVPRVPPVVPPAVITSDPGIWPPDQVNAESLDDYFSRLDAAFSTMGQAPPSPVPLREPEFDVPTLDGLLTGPPVSIPSAEPFAWTEPDSSPRPVTSRPTMSAPAPATPSSTTPATASSSLGGGTIEGNVIAAAFSQMLAAEQGDASTPLRLPSMPKEPVVTDTLIDEIVDRVMDKVMEKMSAGFDRDIVERVVSSVSERLVREEIARIRGTAGGQ